MSKKYTNHFWVLGLPSAEDVCPNSVYFVKNGQTVEIYVSDKDGNILPSNQSNQSDLVQGVTEEEIITVTLSELGATDFEDDIPQKIKDYAIANNIGRLANELHRWEIIDDEELEPFISRNSETKSFTFSASNVLNFLNNLPPYTLTNPENTILKTVKLNSSTGLPVFTRVYQLITKTGNVISSGLFGTGEQQITNQNLQLIGTFTFTGGDIEDAEDTVTIDYGDLGATSVVDHINNLNPSISLNAPTDNLTVIKAIISGVGVSYLFIGSAGNYGLNDNTITNSDLELLEDSEDKFSFKTIMTEAERLAIAAPTVGLSVYQTDASEGDWVYNSDGWKRLVDETDFNMLSATPPVSGTFSINLSKNKGVDYSGATTSLTNISIASGQILGGFARIKGNWATKPTFTGATETSNSNFVESQVLYLYVENWGDGAIYWYSNN